MKPRLLDLFAGAGGAARGYQLAGFHVTGIDNRPQPRYVGDLFIQADALNPPVRLEDFDAIHASPPCQAYSISRNNGSNPDAPRLIAPTLEMLRASGRPWICENVPGAPLPSAVELCGASFGLGVAGMDLSRHRWFELSFPLLVPPCNHRRGHTIGVYGNGTNAWHRRLIGRNVSVDEQREAMGIDWMPRKSLTQAIPPAYTEYLGAALIEVLSSAHLSSERL